ncbi:MAG: hypothetical protein KF720_06145 [Rubrivivax sp.]|nr:hypothetical protein [Rubrivivax sp.]
MPEEPTPPSTPPAEPEALPGWGPWTPGVRLMRRMSPGLRLALSPALVLLPILPWLLPAARLWQAWVPLLVLALYGGVCAVLAAREDTPALALAAAPASPAAPVAAPPRAEAPPAAPEPPAEPPAPEAQMEPEPASEPEAEPEPAPEPAGSLPDPDDFRVGHAELRGATDEIARRVVGASGLLDASAKAAADALADIEALHDEDRHARKLLSALRGRVLQLEQRSHALVREAQQSAPGDDGASPLHKQLQAVEALLLHVHQLAERLGAAEHTHGARLESLRRSVERVDGYAERGLREAQQIMQLTRRVFSTLDAAEQDLKRVEAGGGAAGA